jgi:hypothetical protein
MEGFECRVEDLAFPAEAWDVTVNPSEECPADAPVPPLLRRDARRA